MAGVDRKGFDKHQGVGKNGQTEYAISGSGRGMATSRLNAIDHNPGLNDHLGVNAIIGLSDKI
jgi:hypothetical protein